MMRRTLLFLALLSGQAFAGGSMGGTPPSVAEEIQLSSEEFQSIAFDALRNPARPILINGKLAQPKSIDIQARVMQLESEDKSIIEIKDMK